MILIYIIQLKRLIITQLNTRNNSWYIATIEAVIQYIHVFKKKDSYIIMYPLIYTNNYSGNLYFML